MGMFQMESGGWLAIFVIMLIGIVVLLWFINVPVRHSIAVDYNIFDVLLDCEVIPNCFFQNFNTPYGRIIDPSMLGIIPPGQMFIGVFQLTMLEGYVIFGKAPPSRYWGIVPYLFKRQNPTDPVLFASVSFGISNFSIVRDMDPTAQKLDMTKVPEEVGFIITRNISVFEEERKYLRKVFNGPIYPVYFPGVVTDTDLLSILTRATLFESDDAVRDYVADPGMKGYKVVYADLPMKPPPVQLQDKMILPFDNGLDPVVIPLRPEDPTEWNYIAQFEEFVLRKLCNLKVLREYPFRPFLEEAIGSIYQSGYDCIFNGINCQGDNPQASYSSTDAFELVGDERVAVACVNHTYFGRAFYTQVSLYNDERGTGVDSHFPQDTEPFYFHIFDTERDFTRTRLLERAYVQVPEAVGPNGYTLISGRAFIIPGLKLCKKSNCKNDSSSSDSSC